MHAQFETASYKNAFQVRASDFYGSRPYLYHWHEEAEILLIRAGTVDVGVREAVYHLKAGDLLVIAPNVTHCLFASGPDSARTAVLFNPTMLGRGGQEAADLLCRLACCSTDWPKNAAERIGTLFDTCSQELNQQQPGYEYAVTAAILEFLAVAARSIPKLGQETADGSVGGNAQAILRYISAHYTGDMSLADCAEALGFSMNYLSRMFHQTFAISFSNYVTALRLRQAEWLLLNEPGRSVTDVAYASGFQSIKTFNRVFKNEHGKSPREFRQAGVR